MELSGVMIGSEDPKRLADHYKKVFGEPAMAEDGFWSWQFGSAWVSVFGHSEVKGQNAHPGRIMWNLESSDVPGDFDKLKANGATVAHEPYHPDEEPSMWVATFSDPDGNLFQLMSPMSGPSE